MSELSGKKSSELPVKSSPAGTDYLLLYDPTEPTTSRKTKTSLLTSIANAVSSLIGLGTIATQNANNVTITGGTATAAIFDKGGAGYHVDDYGADSTGVNDSTAGIESARDAAGVNGTVLYKTGGVYKLNSTLHLNVSGQTHWMNGANFPINHAGIGIIMGDPALTGASRVNRIRCYGGKFYRASSDWTSGNIGIRVANTNYCKWYDFTCFGFEIGFQLYALGATGQSYFDGTIQALISNKIGISLLVDGAGSWVNQNTLRGGSVSYSSSDPSAVGGYGVVFDAVNGATNADYANNNTIATSIENPGVLAGDPSGAMSIKGIGNNFEGMRYEGFSSPFIILDTSSESNQFIGGLYFAPSSISGGNGRGLVISKDGIYFGGGDGINPLMDFKEVNSVTNIFLRLKDTLNRTGLLILSDGTTTFGTQPVTGGNLWQRSSGHHLDCSGNPNYPAAIAGDLYNITVAGKIGGASGVPVQAGDVIASLADISTGTQGAVGSSWIVIAGRTVTGIGPLGTPTSGTLTSCTGLPIATGVSGLGTNVATWLATPSSANLASALTTKTGTANVVFSDSPVFSTAMTLGAGTVGIGLNGAGGTFIPQFQNVPTSGVAGIQCLVNDGTNNRRFAMFVDQTNGLVGFSSTFSSGAADLVYINGFGEVFRAEGGTNRRFSLGTSTFSAKLAVLATIEQVRTLYDANNYFSTTVASNGAVTFDAVGAGSGFTFSDAVVCSSSLQVSGLLTATSGVRTGVGAGTTIRVYDNDGTRQNQIIIGADASGSFLNATYSSGGSAILRLQTVSTDAVWVNATQDVGIGSGTISARLHLTKTTEQLRAAYDGSNYASFTVGSAGLLTISGAGTAAGVSFSKPLQYTDLGSSELLTIASGVVTATGNYHKIDTEGAAASDDLDTINWSGGRIILVISCRNSARVVTVKDGTGNLQLAGDMVLDNVFDKLVLFWTGSNFEELCRSNNA